MLTANEQAILRRLLAATRWAALATARDDEPYASWVAVVPSGEPAGFLMHLSQLAAHTRTLLANPRASLAFTEPDTDSGRDPQTLVRASLQGRVEIVERTSADYEAARARYLEALPHAEVQFGLGDFYLMRFTTDHARFVPGFGRAQRIDRKMLLETFPTRS
jgi:putative heme iron utilization protein